MHIPRKNEYNSVHMSLYSFTYIQASFGTFDLALPSTSFSWPEWWTCPFSLYFFLSVFPFCFFFFFLNNSPLTEMALYCDCSTTDLGCCLIHQTDSHDSENETWKMITTSMGLMESFDSDDEKRTCGSVSLNRGIAWFGVSLWHKYETTCQCSELEQIICLKMTFKMTFT